MRFRRHQEAAHASTRWLLAWFALLLLAMVLAVNLALAVAYRLMMPLAHGYPALFFETNTAIVLLFVLGGCWLENLRLREGGPQVARLAGGRPANVSGSMALDRLERRFANIVQELALASGRPTPAAWVLARDDAINAFAAGWGPDDAVIAVTRGALERLTREELQGVVAHEFSHLAHGDTRLNMRLIGLVWGLQLIFDLGRTMAQRDERGHVPASALFGIALIGVGSIGWAAGRLLQAAVSREREFLADASAVKYTRVVAGIGGALRKIAHQQEHREDALVSASARGLSPLFIATRHRGPRWATHPPIAERLFRLYGRDVEPVKPEPLPVPESDEPLIAFVAAGPALAQPEAQRHDVTQQAALRSQALRQREALERIARWHGPGELRAALLALMVDGDDDAGWARWSRATAGSSVAAPVREELQALDAPGRVQTFETLARRGSTLPAPQRRTLLRSARAFAATPATQLRWLALRQLLRARAFVAAPASARGLQPADIGAVAGFLAGRRANPLQTLNAARRMLRRLPAMQRPLLWRQWRDSGAVPGESLAYAAWLLDVPLDSVAQLVAGGQQPQRDA